MFGFKFPSKEEWWFAGKVLVAALAALYIALYLNLDRPSWAVTTSFVATQAFAGSTVSKSVFRVIGTIAGASISVLILNLVQSPPLMIFAISGWVAVCLYLSLMVRGPSNYAYMLGGYTALFVSFPSVDTPLTVFPTAVSRVEEIIVGVLCSALVHALIRPSTVSNAVGGALDAWARDARVWVSKVLHRGSNTLSEVDMLSKMASYPMSVEGMMVHLRYEGIQGRRNANIVAAVHRQLSLLLPMLDSVEARLRAMKTQGLEVPEAVKQFFWDTVAWLDPESEKKISTVTLLQRYDVLLKNLQGHADDWTAVLSLALVMRIRDMIRVIHRVDRLRHAYANKHPVRNLRSVLGIRRRREPDRGLAVLSCFTAATTIGVCCLLWIGLGWTNGASAPMLAAVACSFFAAMDSPVPFVWRFAKYAFIASLIALFYSSYLLPMAHSYVSAALLLAPAFLVLGVLMSRPSTNFIGLVISTMIATLMGFNNRFQPAFIPTIESATAIMVGMLVAMAVIAIMRSRSPQWVARRFAKQGLNDVIATIRQAKQGHDAQVERDALVDRLTDRLYMVLPRMQFDRRKMGVGGNVLTEIRLGANTLDLQRYRGESLPAHDPLGRQIDSCIDAVVAYMQEVRRDIDAQPPQRLLIMLDQLLGQLRLGTMPRRSQLLQAATGMRTVMFPEAERPSTYAGPPSLGAAASAS